MSKGGNLTRNKARTRIVDFEELNSKVVTYRPLPFKEGVHYTVNTETQCWEWSIPFSTPYPSWRGCFVHQLSYAIAYNNADYNTICHHCDNKKCINPAHLYNGDAKSNNRDKTAITEDDCLAMVVMMRQKMKKQVIAQSFGVSTTTVTNVLKGKHWLTKTESYKFRLSQLPI